MHSFWSIYDAMQILQYQKKGFHLNTKKRFRIYIEAASNNHINDDYTQSPNRILIIIIIFIIKIKDWIL